MRAPLQEGLAAAAASSLASVPFSSAISPGLGTKKSCRWQPLTVKQQDRKVLSCGTCRPHSGFRACTPAALWDCLFSAQHSAKLSIFVLCKASLSESRRCASLQQPTAHSD